MRQSLLSLVKKSVVHAAPAVMETVLHVAVVVLPAAMPRLPTAVINPLKPLVAKPNLPLSAFVRPRPLQPRTVKENKHAATRSS
jgi:hypothetical protein